jgi:hypothetical protein
MPDDDPNKPEPSEINLIPNELTIKAGKLTVSVGPPLSRMVPFDHLTPTQFEELVFELLVELGYTNVDWRKGTPKKVSPSDRGRDIEAERRHADVDGYEHVERWFVDAKHYDKGVPPDAIQGLFTWAQSERPNVVLVVASGYLSNGAKDWIKNFVQTNNPPFRVRVWEQPQLSRMLRERQDLLGRFEIEMPFAVRPHREILAAEQEQFDKVWFVRKLNLEAKIAVGEHGPLDPDLQAEVKAAMRVVEGRYPDEDLANVTDWDYGFMSGKLSALRWVLGDEWDFLDT